MYTDDRTTQDVDPTRPAPDAGITTPYAALAHAIRQPSPILPLQSSNRDDAAILAAAIAVRSCHNSPACARRGCADCQRSYGPRRY